MSSDGAARRPYQRLDRMEPSFFILAALSVISALGAMFLKNLVHCALSLIVTFASLAALFLKLDAQFVGFAQVLVYVGAVAILIVFALLLTRGRDAVMLPVVSSSWLAGGVVAVLVFAALAYGLLSGPPSLTPDREAPLLSTRRIGDELMGQYVIALELVGVLLTVALIGAVLIAMHDREESR